MSNYLAKPIKQAMLERMLDNYVKPLPTGPSSPEPVAVPVSSAEKEKENGKPTQPDGVETGTTAAVEKETQTSKTAQQGVDKGAAGS